MNPDQICLININKSFEYEKISREIETINDLETLKNISKSYAKLYLKQQEILLDLKWQNPLPDKN